MSCRHSHPLVNSLHSSFTTVTASSLLWCRLASALLVIVIAMPSRLAASDMTPPVNGTCFFRTSSWALKQRSNCGSRSLYITKTYTDINELGLRLVGGLPGELRHPGFDFSFEVVNRNDLATVALPGGAIFITRGTIDGAKSEVELAGLLAHELSHVVLRHATAQISATDPTSRVRVR